MKQEHAPGKLETHPIESTNVIYTVMEDGRAVEICRTPANTEADRDTARRIVACWNLAENIPTETLESDRLERILSKLEALEKAHSEGNLARLTAERMDAQDEADRLRQQNAEMVQVLKSLRTNCELGPWDKSARAALAKYDQPDNAVADGRKKDIETMLEKGLQYLMKESGNSLPPFFDPHGLEPKGVIRVMLPHLEEEATGLTPEEFQQRYQAELAKPFTAQDIQIFMTELDYTRQIGVMRNQIKAFVRASQFAMNSLSQNTDDAVAQSCITELAKAINNVTSYGTGPVIQERPRPEGEWRFEVEE